MGSPAIFFTFSKKHPLVVLKKIGGGPIFL